MTITCDHCGAQYFVDETKLKKDTVRKKCPKCTHVIVIVRAGTQQPEPGSPPSPAELPPPADSAASPQDNEPFVDDSPTMRVTVMPGADEREPAPPAPPAADEDEEPVELTAVMEEEPAPAPVEIPEPRAEEAVWRILSRTGSISGPFPLSAIIALINDKKVDGLDKVSRAGGPWDKAFTVPDLAIHFRQAGRPAPPAEPPRPVPPPPPRSDRPQHRTTDKPVSPPAVPRPPVELSGIIPVLKKTGILAAIVLGVVAVVLVGKPLISSLTGPGKTVEEKKEDLIVTYGKSVGPVQGTSQEHFLKGEEHFGKNTPEGFLQAEEEFKKALVLKPDFAKAMAFLAETYLRGRDLKADPPRMAEAAELALRSTTVDPQLPEGYMIQAYLKKNQGNLEDAKLLALKALELRPGDLGPNYFLGSVLLEEKRDTEAVPYLEKASAAKPDFPQVHVDLAGIYDRAGNNAGALGHWKALVSISQDNGDWQCGLAFSFLKNTEEDDALSAFRKCVAMKPGLVPARTELIRLLLDVSRKPLEAQEHLEVILGQYMGELITAQVVSFRAILGRIYVETERPEAAITLLEAALAQDQRNTDAHYYLGQAYYMKEKYHEAEREFRTIIQIDPRSSRAHISLGNVLGKFGRPDLAVEEYKAALAIDPTYAEAHYLLGNYNAQRGLTYEAIEEFKRALEHEPHDLKTLYELGIVYYKVGDNDNAIRALKKAKAVDPGYEDVLFHLGEAYNSSGQTRSAAAEFKEYLRVSPAGPFADEAKKMVRMSGR